METLTGLLPSFNSNIYVYRQNLVTSIEKFDKAIAEYHYTNPPIAPLYRLKEEREKAYVIFLEIKKSIDTLESDIKSYGG